MPRTRIASFGWLGLALMGSFAFGCASPPPEAPREGGPSEPRVEYVDRQEILAPLPIRVSLPTRYRAERVLVFVRTWGSRDWSVLELARAGQTWSGEVSCREVSTVTGDTRYFFLALDKDGNAVVGSGSPDWPHVVTVVRNLEGGARSLGDRPVMKCHDPADCPPDLVGCPAYAWLRPACSMDDDCAGGARCAWDGYCGPAETENVVVQVENDLTDEQLLARAVKRATARYKHGGSSAQ